MTPAEAHVWLAAFGAACAQSGLPMIGDNAMWRADNAVHLLRRDEKRLAELNEALSSTQAVKGDGPKT